MAGVKTSILPKLRTCIEMQEYNKSKEQETAELSKIGIKTPSSLATAIVYRGISDFLVAVNQISGDITFCTGSPEKLGELVSYNCVIPRSNDFQIESNLIKGLTIDLLNKYLQNEKYHFVNLVGYKKPSSLLLCQMYAFNPYPDFKDCNVYALTDFDAWFKQVYSLMYNKYVELRFKNGNTCICTASLKRDAQGRVSQHQNVRSTKWVFDVIDISGTYLQIPAFDIEDIYCYTETELESNAVNGVVKIGGKLYTANRYILERYYGSELNSLESLAVRLRWAVEDVTLNCITDLGVLYKKYGFYTERNMPKFVDIASLVEYVESQLTKPTEMGIQSVTLRYLGNPQAVKMGKVGYYRSIKTGVEMEYEIANALDILPSVYHFGGVSKSLGYQALSMGIANGYDVKAVLKKEFERQFGELIGESYVYSCKEQSGMYPLHLTTEMQRSFGESLIGGDYKCNFKEYKDKLCQIVKLNDGQFICDDSVKFLFVNKLVSYLRASGVGNRAKTLGDVAVALVPYVYFCKNNSKGEHLRELVDTIAQQTKALSGVIKMIHEGAEESDTDAWHFKVDKQSQVVSVVYKSLGFEVLYKYVKSRKEKGKVTLSLVKK